MTMKTIVTIAMIIVFAFVAKKIPLEVFVAVGVACLYRYYSYIRQQ
jgi:hypothetical protein